MSKKYDVVLADPPWKYEAWGKNDSGVRTAANYYPVMTIPEIAALKVKDLTAENAVLFMWITWPILFECQEVIEAWGFTYRTLAWVWIKANPTGFGFFMGMGHYTRANSEPCILAVKGRMPVADHGIQSLIYSAVLEHSRKPEDQYRKIDALYPGTRRIELFARRQFPGWDLWGNEVPNSVELADG